MHKSIKLIFIIYSTCITFHRLFPFQNNNQLFFVKLKLLVELLKFNFICMKQKTTFQIEIEAALLSICCGYLKQFYCCILNGERGVSAKCANSIFERSDSVSFIDFNLANAI